MNALVAAYADVPVYRKNLIDSEEALGDTRAEADRARLHYLRAIELIDTFPEQGQLAPTFTKRGVALANKSAAHAPALWWVGAVR